jgi:hypothetical protein
LNCFGENVNCTSPRELLVKETNECVKYCPYKEFTKKYEKLCLRECPPGFMDQKDECICSKKYYRDEKGDLKCDDLCPSTKSLIANETQCVSKCEEAIGNFQFILKENAFQKMIDCLMKD